MSQKDVTAVFDQVSKSLTSKVWFKKGKWRVSTHIFPPNKPAFVTFHVFKDQWFNEERQGIHIESFLAFDKKARSKSSIHVHLLHYDLIPGTKIKRREIAVPVVDAIFDTVSNWDGYRFRTGKYGLQPFTKNLNGNSEDFVGTLVEEITRLCKVVGPAVDSALVPLRKK